MTENTLQDAVCTGESAGGNGLADWPVEARSMMEVISRNPHFGLDRRRSGRQRYHVTGNAAFTDATGRQHATPIYTANLSTSHVAFICASLVPVGASITVNFPLPDGQQKSAPATVQRCRQFYEGWFDCVVRFETTPEPQAPERRWFRWGIGR